MCRHPGVRRSGPTPSPPCAHGHPRRHRQPRQPDGACPRRTVGWWPREGLRQPGAWPPTGGAWRRGLDGPARCAVEKRPPTPGLLRRLPQSAAPRPQAAPSAEPPPRRVASPAAADRRGVIGRGGHPASLLRIGPLSPPARSKRRQPRPGHTAGMSRLWPRTKGDRSPKTAWAEWMAADDAGNTALALALADELLTLTPILRSAGPTWQGSLVGARGDDREALSQLFASRASASTSGRVSACSARRAHSAPRRKPLSRTDSRRGSQTRPRGRDHSASRRPRRVAGRPQARRTARPGASLVKPTVSPRAGAGPAAPAASIAWRSNPASLAVADTENRPDLLVHLGPFRRFGRDRLTRMRHRREVDT